MRFRITRFWLVMCAIAAVPMGLSMGMGAALSAQSFADQQTALRTAKARAAAAEQRSEELRQEASNAGRAAERLAAQRAVLSADIDAAGAQIEAARARITIINSRQNAQRTQLGAASEPMLRLNAALQQMTGRPTALLMVQPEQRLDYIHLRAVMATVDPAIRRRTAAIRAAIAVQKDLRMQELLALKTLNNARGKLGIRRTALAKLLGSNQNRASSLSAGAAIEFEQSIAQGERARDIVEQIDIERMSSESAAALAGLGGPVLRAGSGGTGGSGGFGGSNERSGTASAYLLPKDGQLLSGFNELNDTGYRERGLEMAVEPGSSIAAPAAGKVTFAGAYRSFGQIIIIDHGRGWMTLITNLSGLSASKGDSVSQGETLGTAGAQNPQVGFELRRNGRIIDIAALL